MFSEILIFVLSSGAAFFASSQLLKGRKLFDFDKRKKSAEKIIEDSKEEASEILAQTREKTENRRGFIKTEKERREARISKLEEVLKTKEGLLSKKEERNNELKLREAAVKEENSGIEHSLKGLETKNIEKLSSISGLSVDQVKKQIIDSYTRDLEEEKLDRIKSLEEDIKENAKKIADRKIIGVMQRVSSPTSVENRSVQIRVPKDHIKGKVYGDKGENVSVIEEELDVDVIFNDLPNTISLSAFNLVNRRIAQKAIEKLLRIRGEINPQTVKKAIADARVDTDKELYLIGKKAVDILGLKIDNKDLIRIIGRLQYRTSYGQNIMKHSIEVAWIATMLGYELGLDVETCKVAGFLHDLGKAIDQDPEIQGSHDMLTKQLMEKFDFPPQQVHAAWVHHEAEPPQTPEAWIVIAADAISASRPGARQESIVKYSERIQALEETGKGFDGVKKAFAISAGRELRILLDPDQIKDADMQKLAREIASKVEQDIIYPGKIKINAIRRTDEMEIAK